MSLWETSSALHSKRAWRFGDPARSFFDYERSKLTSVLRGKCLRPGRLLPRSNSIDRAITLLQSLRMAHCYKQFRQPDRNWIVNQRMSDSTSDSTELFCPTIEVLLVTYLDAPWGFFHANCENEVLWYFKLVEDRVTQAELATRVSGPAPIRRRGYGHHSNSNACTISSLENVFDRVLRIGIHFASTKFAVGAHMQQCIRVSLSDN